MNTTVIFAELAVGDVVAERVTRLTRDSLVRYAGASGDFNPIHYRDDVAHSVGLPGVLAHGMLTMGVAGAPVTAVLPAGAWVRDYQTRFTRPVPVAGELGAEFAEVSVRATVGAIDTEARTVRFDVAVVFEERTVLGKSQLLVQFS